MVDVPDGPTRGSHWQAQATQARNAPCLSTPQISCLRSVAKGTFASAGDVVATVEPVAGQGNVFFVRFFAGSASK